MSLTAKLDRLLIATGACLLVATVALVLLARPADTRSTTAGAAQPATGTNRIVIRDFKFLPERLQVKAGTKLTVVNEDTAPHTATDTTTEAFDTGNLGKGDEKTITLRRTGTFDYICEIHPFMKATIQVVG